jgi:hypothetical protein
LFKTELEIDYSKYNDVQQMNDLLTNTVTQFDSLLQDYNSNIDNSNISSIIRQLLYQVYTKHSFSRSYQNLLFDLGNKTDEKLKQEVQQMDEIIINGLILETKLIQHYNCVVN